MGWFWADSNASSNTGKLLKVNGSDIPAVCPMRSSSDNSEKLPATCPMRDDKDKSNIEDINPLNNMPTFISSKMALGQQSALPTERTVSTIPRGDDTKQGFWEYPSPQQMFNAMLRKGKLTSDAEDSVESMVDVHNFLNEEAWQEILEWEKPHIIDQPPRLLKFTGKPHDLSPRAQMYLSLSKIFPNSFNGEPPFDRHDWTVLRNVGEDEETGIPKWREIRYVIDYYGGPDNEEGYPTFFLDVRPGLDNVENAVDRFKHWSMPLVSKALGSPHEPLVSTAEKK